MGDWDVSCAICGVIFAPGLVEIESENGPSPEGKPAINVPFCLGQA